MSLNARLTKDDNRLYSPSRDLAHNFDQVILEVARRCEEGTWDSLVKLAKDNNVSDEELGKACQALCNFVARHPDRNESMAQCLVQSKFLELSPIARIIVSAYMGTVLLGMHWSGVREATLGGVGPTLTYQKLRWFGKKCTILMKLPRWRRKLYMLWIRIKKSWRTFWEKDIYDK